jgi:hypothetical protein
MLSRVADALFWMARYYERAENTSRLIDVNINMMLDMGHALSDAGSSAPYWNPIIRITSPFDQFRALYPKTTQESALEWLTFDENNRTRFSVASAARAKTPAPFVARFPARCGSRSTRHTARERFDQCRHLARRAASLLPARREASQLFQGMVKSTQPRD